MTSKRTGQAFFFFLGEPKTRDAARAFLRYLDPQEVFPPSGVGGKNVLIEESYDMSLFWYYLPAVFQKLISPAVGLNEEEAGRALVYWFKNFEKTRRILGDVDDLLVDWKDWNGDFQYLTSHVVSELSGFALTSRSRDSGWDGVARRMEGQRETKMTSGARILTHWIISTGFLYYLASDKKTGKPRNGQTGNEAMKAVVMPGNDLVEKNLSSRISLAGTNDAVMAKGGIDLNPAQMSMRVKKEGEDFKFDFNGTKINASQITGATFTIRTMTPVTNLPELLGLNAGPANRPKQGLLAKA